AIYRSEEMFDYIFTDDVAEGLLKLANIDSRGVVNLGSGRARTASEVVQVLKQFFPSLKIEDMKSSIPFEASQASIERLTSLTGWHPPHTLEMAIPKLIEFEKEALKEQTKITEHSSVLITSISKKMP